MDVDNDVLRKSIKLEELSQGILFLVVLIFCGGTFFMTNMSRIPLPYTVVLFLYGIFVGFVAHVFTPDVCKALGDIPPELLFYIFLPVLIFEGSYAMNVHALRVVFPQVLLLASVGVVINTGLLALPVIWFYPTWSWYTALLLGSLLSATDPVAVVSLLKGLGVDKRLTAMVDGEAILNDGTAIIAFKLLLSAARTGQINSSSLFIFLRCLQLTILPVIIGPVFGFIQAYWLRRASGGLVRACVTVSVTYVTYYVAGNLMGTSGVLTLFFSGTFLSYYCPSVFPGREGNLIYDIWAFLVHLGNTVLFSLVGVILVADVIPTLNLVDVVVIICMYAAMIFARLLMLECLLPILNLFSYKLTQREVALLVYSGLRGGVAVTLALAVSQTKIEPGAEILKITSGVVLLTLFINATTAEKIVALLGHKKKEKHRLLQMTYALEHLKLAGQRAFQVAKNNPLYRCANWAAAESYVKTYVENPFRGMSCLDEDDDTVLNRLLMRAFKSSLWRQRDNDMVSETVVLTLSRVVSHAIDDARLVEIRDLIAGEARFYIDCTDEEEARLIEANLLPLWVTLSERFLGSGYWTDAHERVQQNTLMVLLSFARCLTDIEPVKYQYAKNESQGRRVDAWITAQREEAFRVMRLFDEVYPSAAMSIATTRAVLRAVYDIHKELGRLHEDHGFGLKTIAAMGDVLHLMHERIPRSWEAPRRDNELVLAALAATPLGRGLTFAEINAIGAMGITSTLNEGEEIQVDEHFFYVVVFGSLKSKRGRWTTSDEGACGFGKVIGLETFVTPPQLRENKLNRWVVTSSVCQVLCISYGSVRPFLREKSFAAVEAFWRAVAVETLLPTVEDMVTLPSNLVESRDYYTAIIMDGKPLIGPKECNSMDVSRQFHLFFYLRGSDTSGLFRNGHTTPCYISAFFANQLKWEDPLVVLFTISVNWGDSGYIPWLSDEQSACSPKRTSSALVKGDLYHQRRSSASSTIVSIEESLEEYIPMEFVQDESTTYAKATGILNAILCGRLPGDNIPTSPTLEHTITEFSNFNDANVCVFQDPSLFVTAVPYVNQLFLRYAAILEGLCVAALQYVRRPSDPYNVKHAQAISEQALDFLMVFGNELSVLVGALRRFQAFSSRNESIEEADKNELEDMQMMCKVIMWNRMAASHRTFHLRSILLQMKSLANRRFHGLAESLKVIAEQHQTLKDAGSVEEIRRILIDQNSRNIVT